MFFVVKANAKGKARKSARYCNSTVSFVVLQREVVMSPTAENELGDTANQVKEGGREGGNER